MNATTKSTGQRHEVSIRATAEQIWEAITSPQFTTKYFYGSVIESTFTPGSAYSCWAEDRSQQFADGEVLEAHPPRLLRHSWRTLWDEDAALEPRSRVSWLIDPQEDGTTILTVVHDQLESAPKTAASVADGWGGIVGALKELLETSSTRDAQTSAPATQLYELFIDASPEAIWEAITTEEFTDKYFFGGRVRISANRRQSLGSDGSVRGDSEVFAFEPPVRLVHEWRSLYDPDMAVEQSSRVSWEIERQEDGTSLLTVIHDRLEGAPLTAAGVGGRGWMRVLSGLKTLLETGRPLGVH